MVTGIVDTLQGTLEAYTVEDGGIIVTIMTEKQDTKDILIPEALLTEFTPYEDNFECHLAIGSEIKLDIENGEALKMDFV